MHLGINIGEQIAQKLETGHIELPEKETYRLVGIRLDGVTEGKVTVPALRRQQGVIVVGSAGPLSTESRALNTLRAYRFLFTPVVLDAKQKTVVHKCAISPARRVHIECPRCELDELIWYDRWMKRRSKRKANYKDNPLEDIKNPNFRTLLCDRCKREGVGVELKSTPLKDSLLPGKGRNTDPVYQSVDDPDLQALLAEATNVTESRIGAPILPRVWAIYPMHKAPTNWMPTDPRASEIERRVREQGNTIRPFDVARKNDGGYLKGMVLEANPGMQIGWVKESDLNTRAFGFNRRFVNEVVHKNSTRNLARDYAV